MSHIPGHNKTGNCTGRSQHDNDGNQFVLCEATADGERQEKCFVAYKLHEGTYDRGFQSGKSFSKVKRATHGHQSQRRCGFCKITCCGIKDFREREAEKGPKRTGSDAKDDRVGDNAFQRPLQNSKVQFFLIRFKYRKYYNSHNIIKWYTCNDHKGCHTCVSVKILDNGNAKDRGTASVGCLDKLTAYV